MQGRKLLESVGEGKAVENGIRRRVEEHGRVAVSWAGAFCVGRGALTAGKNGQPFVSPHKVVLPLFPPCTPAESGPALPHLGSASLHYSCPDSECQ